MFGNRPGDWSLLCENSTNSKISLYFMLKKLWTISFPYSGWNSRKFGEIENSMDGLNEC